MDNQLASWPLRQKRHSRDNTNATETMGYVHLPDEILVSIFWATTEDGTRKEQYASLLNCMTLNKRLSRIAKEVLLHHESLGRQPLRLMHAMSTGDLESVKEIFSGRFKRPIEVMVALKRGPQSCQWHHYSLLMLAAAFGHSHILEYFLSIGADPNRCIDIPGFDAHESYRFVPDELRLEYVVQGDQAWDRIPLGGLRFRVPSFETAIRNGHEEAALIILRGTVPTPSSMVYTAGQRCIPRALVCAIGLNAVNIVRYILDGMDFDVTENGRIDLFTYVDWQSVQRDMIERLLAAGSNPRGRSPFGFGLSYFTAAVRGRNVEAAHALLDAGACPMDDVESILVRTGAISITQARIRSQEAAVLMGRLIERGLEVTKSVEGQYTLLYLECFGRDNELGSEYKYARCDDLSLARLLLKSGAGLEIRDEHKCPAAPCSPFWLKALVRGMSRLCSLLQEFGARVPRTDEEFINVIVLALAYDSAKLQDSRQSWVFDESRHCRNFSGYHKHIFKFLVEMSPKTSFLRRPDEAIPWLRKVRLPQLVPCYENMKCLRTRK